MIGRWLALSLALLLPPAAHALAQETIPDLLPEIVVEAPGEAQLQGFVGEALSHSHKKQLARWHRPICATLRGFVGGQEQRFARRLQEAAAIAGLEQAPAGCRPNVIVLLTNDPDRLVDLMLVKHARIFAPAPLSAVRRDLGRGGAARFWYLTISNNAQGNTPDIMDVSGTSVASLMRVAPGNASRIGMATRADMFRSLVVLDEKGLRGLPLEAVADHVALRLLGRIDETERTPVPSVLNLFQPGGFRPMAMTDWDRALLRELYTAPVGADADRQRRQIARRLVETAGDAKQ
ncbi:hypothetical protein [Niveispirillum sp. KHB5.9]|uniref:hypothetical protein n=1 Tax=Niveispirillum sp. KHB5.9 TaxID=3400269 RepID=UPI003A86E30E